MPNTSEITRLVDRLVSIIEKETEAKTELLNVAGEIMKLLGNRKSADGNKEEIPISPEVLIGKKAATVVISREDKIVFEKELERAINYIRGGIINISSNVNDPILKVGALTNGSPLRTRIAQEVHTNYINTNTGNLFDNATWIDAAEKYVSTWRNQTTLQRVIVEILKSALDLRNPPRI